LSRAGRAPDSGLAAPGSAPTRITLGGDAYSYVHTALAERLAVLEAQKDLAFSTDFPAGA